MKQVIGDEEIKALMSAIERRYGLDFTNYEIKSLKRGIFRLMMKRKLKNILELWSIILKDEEFFKESIDDLMVNLTELFRNPDAWMKIKSIVSENFKDTPILKIWHAGCSTGEEVYTMAIILKELNRLPRTKALATDLSSRVLKKAKEGQYSLLVMQNYLKPFLEFFPNKKMEDFFDFEEFNANVKSELKSHVNFKRHNLAQDPMNEKFDIIFCRNVMIYFDETLKLHVLNMFNSVLNEGGFLVIGYYDTMPKSGADIFDIYDNKTRIYKKKLNN
ncbi:MAG: protein-glutamate O-methyltransferase CheR [Cyclobacteriaceae bacterium]|nr:protein-glutamate O-methyltransferase CheR [Cyclobacteriaceae bacterium]